MEKELIEAYCGSAKGKTTLGLATEPSRSC